MRLKVTFGDGATSICCQGRSCQGAIANISTLTFAKHDFGRNLRLAPCPADVGPE